MKRLLSLLLTLALALTCAPVIPLQVNAAILESGTCGENLTWTLDDVGVLTISGVGPMEEFSTTLDKPWNSNRSKIVTVMIEDGVTSIGRYAFYYCENLTNIIVPDSIENINSSAFGGCTSLIQEEGGVSYAGNIVYDCDPSVTEVVLRENIVAIASSAFQSCSSLTSITIPKSVVSIGDQAFSGCTALTTVTFEQGSILKCIGDSAFSDLRSLTSINIPDSVTNIGDSAFYYCSALTSFTIPSKLVNIGENAFHNSKVKDIYVSDIGAYLSINVKDRNSLPWATEKLHILDDYGYEQTNLVIPQGITNIREYAFYNATSITSVFIPGSIKNIETYAFLNEDYQITFTYCGTHSQWQDVTREQYWAKYKGWGYVDAPIYAYHKYNSIGVCTICGSGAEGSCGENLTWKIEPSTQTLTISGSGEMEDFWSGTSMPWNTYKSSIKTIIIESGVTSIGTYAFYGCDNATTVRISDSVTDIHYYAFYGCNDLGTVYYQGTEGQKKDVTIDHNNQPLTSATWYYEGNEALYKQEDIEAYYKTLEEALVAVTDGTITLLADVSIETVSINQNVVLDLNGHMLTVDSVAGCVMDSADGKGLIQVDAQGAMLKSPSGQLTLWDNGASGYRVFKSTFESKDIDADGTDAEQTEQSGKLVKSFWSELCFENRDAYTLVASGKSGLGIGFDVSWTPDGGEASAKSFAFDPDVVAQWGEAEADDMENAKAYYFYIRITGFENLTGSGMLEVTPTVKDVFNNGFTAEVMEYSHGS